MARLYCCHCLLAMDAEALEINEDIRYNRMSISIRCLMSCKGIDINKSYKETHTYTFLHTQTQQQQNTESLCKTTNKNIKTEIYIYSSMIIFLFLDGHIYLLRSRSGRRAGLI